MPLPRLPQLTALSLAACLAAATAAETNSPAQADLGLGARLIREHKCNDCHARRVGGDGSAIYRPKGRISSLAALRSQVEYCSTQLNLQLFPEEIEAIAAVLDRDHYHFR